MGGFIVPIALFTMIVLIVKLGIDYAKWEKEREVGDYDRTLGTRELEGLIEEAVERATAPLQERIDRLERRLPASTEASERAVGDEHAE